MVTRSIAWAACAGVYAYLGGVVLTSVLSPVSQTLAVVLGQPRAFGAFLLAGPAVILGAVGWWVLIERRGADSYLLGPVFGVLTAFSTVCFWVLVFVSRVGLDLVSTGTAVIGLVLAVALPAGFVAGIPVVYVRRRLDDSVPARGGQSGPSVTEEG